MTNDIHQPTAEVLPERLADVFRLLRNGRHLCGDDGADYRDLHCNEDRYRLVFAALGYELVSHGQGFYYFKGSNYLPTKRLKAIALFMFILFQDLEDKKFQEAERAWERKLLMRTFKIAELPHFATSQRRSMLQAVGVEENSLNDNVLRPMERLGMLAMTAKGAFEFRAPIYRFVELCIQFAGENWTANANGQQQAAATAEPESSGPDTEDADLEESSL